MYQFELKHVSNQEVSREVLSMIENLCDEFHMENDFGIISMSMQQLIDMIGTYTNHSDNTFSITFTMDDNTLTIALRHQLSLAGFEAHMQDTSHDDSLIIHRLVDHFEFQDEGRQWSLEYEIHTQDSPSATTDNSLAEERQMTLLEKQLIVNPQKTVKQ